MEASQLIQGSKMKEFVFCIDSDGCAMDTMTFKHQLYFGPIAAKVFNISDADNFVREWNETNLYRLTRGINRFVGLKEALEKAKVKGMDNFYNWVLNTKSYSNESLKAEIDLKQTEDLKLALKWSNLVNEAIKNHPIKAKSFKGVFDCLKKYHQIADIYVVSSANKQAVLEEFENEGLTAFVREIYCQDKGKKEDIIKMLIEAGYDQTKMIMIGDALGDLKAAKVNNIRFYPILANKEVESWSLFKDKYADAFLKGDLDDLMQLSLIESFENNLK